MQKLLIIFTSILATGCTAKYMQNDVSTNQGKLDSRQPVTIATPVDGRYDAKAYSGSGEMTATAVRAAFSRYSNQVKVIPTCQDIACLRQHSTSGYYVVPEILHWEDRATEWSGIPGKIQVKLAVYDLNGTEPLAATVITGQSKWATFGGDHPQDLLPQPLSEYVKAQY